MMRCVSEKIINEVFNCFWLGDVCMVNIDVKRKEKKDKSKDEQRVDIVNGLQDEEVYTGAGRQELVDDDEISPEEEGFMEGAEGRGQESSCAHCGRLLGDRGEGVFERKVGGKLFFFCSEACAVKGKR